MGGATAAYYLRKLFGQRVGITLFEQTGRIGGRMKSIHFDGQQYEAGASIFHQRNKYMYTFSRQFGLHLKDETIDDDRLMFTNGIDRAAGFNTLGGPKFTVPLRLFWNYGLQFIRLKWEITSLVRDFGKIYHLQDAGSCFTTTARLLEAMRPQFVEMTQWTHGDWISKRWKLSDTFKEELAFGLVSNNYNQDLNVHAFVGAITLATTTSKLYSVEEGNEMVPRRLVEEALMDNPKGSPSNIVHAGVTAVRQHLTRDAPATEVPKYTVEYRMAGEKKSTLQGTFDYVIVAAPMHQNSNLELDAPIVKTNAPYQPVDHTFIKGILKHSFFGLKPGGYTPSQGLVILPTQTGYKTDQSLFRSLLAPISGKQTNSQSRVWIFFSNPARLANPQKELLDRYFEEPTEVEPKAHLERWLAYPVYRPLKNPSVDLGSFILAPRVYYANAIEQAASCMEIAAIGGRNVALLLAQDRSNSKHDVDVGK